MSTVYEARAFLHEAPYPSMTDVDHDRTDGERFGETDVSELANYNAQSSLLQDDRASFDDAEGRSMVSPDAVDTAFNAARLLPGAPAQTSSQHIMLPDLSSHSEQTPTPAPVPTAGSASPSSKANRASASRAQLIPKPERTVNKHPDGMYYCAWEGCTETATGFKRRCEWSKHMDKHERPYRCEHEGCEKLSGFTYSGGLLRHQREVHNKHGGPKKTLNCPHQSCKRFTGKGFSRQENLNEHLRRVHTEGATSPPAEDGNGHAASDDGGERGVKRKRDSLEREEEQGDLLEEVKRLREENDQLRDALHQQRETQITMVAQIADLQGALRLNDANLGGAQMV